MLYGSIEPTKEMLEAAKKLLPGDHNTGIRRARIRDLALGMAYAAKAIEEDAKESARVCQVERDSPEFAALNNPEAEISFNGRIFGFQNFGHRVARGDWIKKLDEDVSDGKS